MKAEDAIVAIEEAASYYPTTDLDLFSERVREDLAVFRRKIPPHRFERPPSRDFRHPEPQLELSVPDKYREDAEVWIVFSTFVACFLDPADFGSYAMGAFRELRGSSELERIAFISDARREEEPEEIELRDYEHVLKDINEMRALVNEIGRSLFGDRFDPEDIGRRYKNVD